MKTKELCISLIEADSARDIKNILKKENLWDDESLWRPFGDVMNNFGSIGNQQSDPVAALVEKIINSIDARLMGFADERGIKPTDPEGFVIARSGRVVKLVNRLRFSRQNRKVNQ